MKILVCALALINLIGYVLMFVDKRQAVMHRQRVSEFTFFIIACLGGWLAILIAIFQFHHKNRKPSFGLKIGAGFLIFCAWIALIIEMKVI